MREILFRGKRIDNGELVEGQYHCTDYIWNDEEIRRHYILPQNYGDAFVVNPETVGQFTELTDKKGKRIFEGDICRVSRPCVLAYGKITFQNGCFWFVDDGPGGMLRLCDVKTNGFEIEVIGNIHDNPELLEG